MNLYRLSGLLAVSALLVGCDTAPGGLGSLPPQEATATGKPSQLAYGWHDPAFYQPWHDASAVILPPPPFTGFDGDGRTAPMLPTRRRPAEVASEGKVTREE